MWGPTNGTKEGGLLFPLSTSFKAPFGLIFTVPSKECFSHLWPKALVFHCHLIHPLPPTDTCPILAASTDKVSLAYIVPQFFFFSKFLISQSPPPPRFFGLFMLHLFICFSFSSCLVRLISKYSCSFKRSKLWLGL